MALGVLVQKNLNLKLNRPISLCFELIIPCLVIVLFSYLKNLIPTDSQPGGWWGQPLWYQVDKDSSKLLSHVLCYWFPFVYHLPPS